MAEAPLQEMAQKVIELCGPRRMSDVCVDLEKTQSVEATVNRILDGSFLEGTSRDPSMQAHIILDSDDNDDQAVESTRSSTVQQQLSQNISTAPISLISSSPETDRLLLSSPPVARLSPRLHSPPLPATAADSQTVTCNDPADSDNDSLPSLGELMAKMTSARKSARNVSYSSQPLPNQDSSGKSIDVIDIVDDDDNNYDDDDDDDKGSKYVVNDANADTATQKSRPKRKLKRKRQDDDDDDDVIFSRHRNTSSSLPLDYLRQWESSENEENDDVSQQPTETVKEKKERLRKEKQTERQRKAEEKKRAQEEKKRKKKEEKAAKEAERQRKKLIEQANKLRTDRYDLKDMILDVDHKFASSERGEMLRGVVESKEAVLNVVHRDHPYTVAWRRKHLSEWNAEEERFVPFEDNQPRIKQENHFLIFMEVDELCELIKTKRLDARIDKVKNMVASDKQIMLMVEGLENYYKRKTLIMQRQFEKAVLQNIGQNKEQASSGRSKRRGKTDKLAAAAENGPEKHVVEEVLTYLQMMRDVMLVPTTDANDSVEWLLSITADLAGSFQNRLKLMNKHYHAPSHTATDPSDTWAKMLQEVQLCTPAVAKAIVEAYPTVQSLHQCYEESSDPENALTNLQVERSVVSSRDRTINRAMSKRIYTIFSSDDPELVLF